MNVHCPHCDTCLSITGAHVGAVVKLSCPACGDDFWLEVRSERGRMVELQVNEIELRAKPGRPVAV